MKFALAASAITTSFGPHSAVDGYQVGRARPSNAPAHDGERHPDGDELLYATARSKRGSTYCAAAKRRQAQSPASATSRLVPTRGNMTAGTATSTPTSNRLLRSASGAARRPLGRRFHHIVAAEIASTTIATQPASIR